MINKEIENITIHDLSLLISDGVLEKKTLEYKEKFPGNTDDEKREFLKDITSFANSSGGDIIYGVKEENGVPTKLTGIDNSEIDGKILWIEDLLRQCVQPRIPNYKSQLIDINDNRKILIIRIPMSWRSPHIITFKNWSRFFARSSNGVYQLDVDELRSAFLLSETISDKINNFKNDRIANIYANETSMKLYNNEKIILHIIPITAYNISSKKINIKEVFNTHILSPIHHPPIRRRINFDGMILYSDTIETGSVESYIQLYKNGIIEAVETCLLSLSDNGRKYIPHYAMEKSLIDSVNQYVNFLKLLNIELPYLVYITLTGVKGYMIGKGSMYFPSNEQIDRDILCPEAALIENNEEKIEKTLKPLFDSIWNACGYTQSINFDEKGCFKL